MNPPEILIAGVGNIFFGDDGFGVEVARRLAKCRLPEDVRVVDFGIRSYDLAFALLDGPPLTILADATYRGGEPGTLYTIEPGSEADQEAQQASVDGHRLDVMQVLRMASEMGGCPGRVLLVGCEPATFGPEEEGMMGLSPAVAAAVDRALEIIQSLIARHRIDRPLPVSVVA